MREETREYLARATAGLCKARYTNEETCYQPAGHENEHGPRGPIVFSQVTDDRAIHAFPIYAQEELCSCGFKAAHKIEETAGPSNFHPLTAYLCCACFGRTVGVCGRYPYDPAAP